MSDPRGLRQPASRWLAPAALLIVAVGILAATHTRGWYPHDEGALGESALRFLGGEWPHRDFDEIYTGALTAWHAAWFRLLGASAATMRIALAVTALPWLLLVYAIARRSAAPWAAAGIAATAFVWTLPVYPASMPSWYILFCATVAAWATLRWHDSRRLRWIFFAGLAAGVAVLFKLNGILITAGVGLALVTSWIADDPDAPDAPSGIPRRLLALPLLLIAAMLAVALGHAGAREFTRFCVPLGLVLIASAIAAWQRGGRFAPRQVVTPLVLMLGTALPLLALVAVYARLDAVPALVDGVLVAPFRRVAFAAKTPPSPEVFELALPMLLLLLLPSARARWAGPVARLGGAFFTFVFIGAAYRFTIYRYAWYSVWGLLFVVALAAAALILTRNRQPRERHAAIDGARALACLALGLALIEYPFASAIYVIYSLPLVMLAAAALLRSGGWMHPWAQGVALAFFLAFGTFRILPGGLDGLAMYYAPTAQTARLAVPRGGITVSAADSARYTAVVPFIQEVAAGRRIWAGPDAPEIYFLTGLPNSTRTFFDFFDADSIAAVPLPERLARFGVDVVVVKDVPSFSPALTADVRAALATAYPQARQFPGFEVRWR